MKEKIRHILLATMFTAFLSAALFMPLPLSAGPLEPPPIAVDPSGNPLPTMRTLSEVGIPITGTYSCGDIPPGVRFIDDSDGTVTDCKTGLMWEKDADGWGHIVTWDDALNECSSLQLGGYDDWRLPEIQEFENLVDTNYRGPALSNGAGTGRWTEGDIFLKLSAAKIQYFWSATLESSNIAFLINMYDGSSLTRQKGVYEGHVWCVR